MNLQESIRRILREELSPRVRRRVAPDEMEKEFLESFDYAYKIKKRTKVSPTDFLDELIYSTITILLDGFHWKFVSTLPEDEFWYDDIHTELENHYKDRIKEMYNERRGINESILKEETELPAYIRRRVTPNDLEWLVRDVKISLSRGKNKSDALYDAIQNLISSNRELLKDYDMFQDVYAFDEPLIRYINSKLDEEPLNESILMEELSPRVRRRVNLIDDEVEKLLRIAYTPNVICRNYTGGNELINVISHAVIENLYFNTFYEMDDDSKEWEEIAQFIWDYVHEKFGERIKTHYEDNCE